MAFDGFGDETERVATVPNFSLFFEPVYHRFFYSLFLHYYEVLGLGLKPVVLRYAQCCLFVL